MAAFAISDEAQQVMENYRLTLIDTAGHVTDVYDVECDSDETAYYVAEKVRDDRAIDIWQGDRWIAWLDPKYRVAHN